MRGAVRPLAVLAILVGVIAAGCATSVDVAFDEHRDFSRYRTWNWVPGGSRLEAPEGAERVGLQAAEIVRRALRGRGLVRTRDEPDLLVAYDLVVTRKLVKVHETGAENLLASHHSSPSFYVQATEERVEPYHDITLRIVVALPQSGRPVVWQGELRTRCQGDFRPHLGDAVSQLLSRFPSTTQTSEAPTSSSRDAPPAASGVS